MRKTKVQYRRKLGQHFLQDKQIIKRMIQLAKLKKDDIVLEVGAGKGSLTTPIIKKTKRTFIVEKDKQLFKLLERMFLENPKVHFYRGDILTLRLPKYDKIVSSLPYSISSKFFLWLMRQDFQTAVLLLQKEYADKLIAPPGSKKYGRLTVLSGHAFNIKICETVTPEAFMPPPKIISSIVIVTKKHIISNFDENFFVDFVSYLFSQRRKKLNRAVRKFVKRFSGSLSVFEQVEIPDKRVYETSIEEFERLSSPLSSIINSNSL
ncbi:16S rRNA (adenine(1518)-N(6)/adenine(1519)-N(6))-dimethyltransferase RsmA [[Eubacterium] cellulosolvens]